jgi:hypothetical protein
MTGQQEQPASQPAEKHPQLYHEDSFEYRGYTFVVTFPPDEDMGPPWKEHDGHGVISEWTTRREKKPGELILAEDCGSRRYYDLQATMAIARRDQWGCGDPTHEHTTARQRTVCAVHRDFEFCRRWLADEWQWIGVVVRLADPHRDVGESVWGIESDAGEYLTETAYELADEIMSRIEVDWPDVQLSEN